MAASAKLDLILELKNRLSAGFGKARQFVNSEMKGMTDKVSQFRSSVTNQFNMMGSTFKGWFKGLSDSSSKAFTAIKEEVPGVGRALALLANPYALAAAGALALGAGVVKATSMAQQWKTSMAEVNVTAQLSKTELKGLSDQLLRIGANGSVELEQVPKAFNRIISAGLSVNKSLEALEPTLKAAKAGFTDIETVAAAGIGVMKSSGENINVVYDTLFATLNKGNAAFKDIAQYLPKIIPGARQAGFALGETAGAWAYLTAQGQSAEQSTTSLMNAFKALSRPEVVYGTKTKAGFKQIGVDIFDVHGKMRPLVDIVTDLGKAMNGLTDEQRVKKFASIGLDMEAAGAFASMTQNVSELKSTIDFTTNSAGQLNEAVKNSATGTEGWVSGMNKIKKMAIDFGSLFLPVVETAGVYFNVFVQKIQEGVDWFKQLYDRSVLLQDIVSYLGFLITAPFKLVGLYFKGLISMYQWLDSKLGITDKVMAFFDKLELFWIGLKATASGVISIFSELWKIIEPLGRVLTNLWNPKALYSAVQDARTAFSNMDLSGAFNKGFQDSIRESWKAKKAATETLNPAGVEAPVGAGITPSTGAAEATDEMQVNGGTPQKYINITIQHLGHQGDIYNQETGADGMTLDELERKMNEIWYRLLRNTNAAF